MQLLRLRIRKKLIEPPTYCKVDSDLFDELAARSICLNCRGYAQLTDKGKTILLHRFVTKAKAGEIIDHINGDKLDNRKSNLRIATASLNMHNRQRSGVTSKYRGVCLINRKKHNPNANDRWECQISRRKYTSELEAAQSYNYEAHKKWGENAILNSIETPSDWRPTCQFLRKRHRSKGSINLLKTGKYSASYKKDGRYINLGIYENVEEAEAVIAGLITKHSNFEIPRDENDVAILIMPCGQTIMLDDADYNFYRDKGVRKGINGYPQNVRSRELLHREIMLAPKGSLVDHIDNNIFNNQRKNLRIVTHSQNSQNVAARNDTGYKGVRRVHTGNYQARITQNGKVKLLGTYGNKEAAAYAYNVNAIELFGKEARLNKTIEVWPTIRKVKPNGSSVIIVSEIESHHAIRKTKYRGVTVAKNSFIAVYKKVRLGSFETEDQAAYIYDVVAKNIEGLTAKLNNVTMPKSITKKQKGLNLKITPDDVKTITQLYVN